MTASTLRETAAEGIDGEPMAPADEDLVERALRGSGQAWRQLLGRYERRLYNHALRLTGHRDDAVDLTQEILLAVFRNLPTFRGECPFSAWVFRIAAYRCTDHLRRRRIHDPFDETTAERTGDGRKEPETAAGVQRTNERIRAALARLPDEQRLVVELKFFQQFTFEDIAGQLGISPNTAKTRLYAALRKLRGDRDLEALESAR